LQQAIVYINPFIAIYQWPNAVTGHYPTQTHGNRMRIYGKKWLAQMEQRLPVLNKSLVSQLIPTA
jgi:hypothetical protein